LDTEINHSFTQAEDERLHDHRDGQWNAIGGNRAPEAEQGQGQFNRRIAELPSHQR
jgi:hypothetical protein